MLVKFMLGAGLKKLLHFLVPCLPSTPFLGGAVLSNSCFKVDELVDSRNSGDNILKVFIELVFCLIRVGYGGCLGADDGSELFHIVIVKFALS